MTIKNRTNLKIWLSWSNWAFLDYINLDKVKNIDSIKYSWNIWWWQWEIDLSLWIKYDDINYIENQLIEISAYNSDNPSWILKYAWFIKNINRTLSQENWESLDLEILWLWSILWEYSGSFIVNKPLNQVIDDFITQFNWVYSISSTLEFIWSTLFKNWITDITNVNINKTWTYFEILKEIFNLVNKTFYISKNWTIFLWDQSIIKHILTWNKEIVEMKISWTRETQITLTWFDYTIEPGDKILLENINQNYNLDNQRVEKVEYWLLETTIYLWQIWSLWTQILKW